MVVSLSLSLSQGIWVSMWCMSSSLSSARSSTNVRNVWCTPAMSTLQSQVTATNTHRQLIKKWRNWYFREIKHHVHLQSFTRQTPRTMRCPACLTGPYSKNTVDHQSVGCAVLFSTWSARASVCVSDSEYRPLLPYTESTGRILLTALNPVDIRKWRRKPWSWRVVKVLKVCKLAGNGGVRGASSSTIFAAGRRPWRSCCCCASL